MKTIQIILVFAMAIFITYLVITCCSIEEFEGRAPVKKLGRDGMSKTMNILTDNMFKNLEVYNNDDDLDKEGHFTGLEKCLDKCDGVCVEFGVTSIAFCFPKE